MPHHSALKFFFHVVKGGIDPAYTRVYAGGLMVPKKSGRQQLMSGIMELMWTELKSMNLVKLKIYYKIAVGYITMKYFGPKKIAKRSDRSDIETTYRISR